MRTWSEPPKDPAPLFWRLLCEEMLEASPALASKLWKAFRAGFPLSSSLLAFKMHRLLQGDSFDPHRRLIWDARLDAVRRDLPPRLLLDLARRISPEDGRLRTREVAQFEEAVLSFVGPDGAWKGPEHTNSRQTVDVNFTKGVAP